MSINGNMHIDQATLDRKTLYTNPYLIVTEAEYTKHYYAESQRIASKLGGGWANALVDPLNDHLPETPNFYYNELNSKLEVGLGKRAECVGMDPNYVFVQDGFTAIEDQYGVSDPEINQYFYHPDHLGSSSFITNASGNVDQHLQYLPFGEPWIDQRTSNNIRFTFSGKELDSETGYNYFGARYYNADISIWLSIDPLSDQYPSHSGYNYVMNNPIKLVDPNGMWVEGAGLLNNFFKSDERNKAEMKAKQLSAEGASNISVNRIDGGWQTSYTSENSYKDEGIDHALHESGFIDFDKSRRGSSPITGILAAASTNASYFEAVFKNDAKHKFNYAQKINGKWKSALDITKDNAASSLKTARGLSRIGAGLTFLSVFATAVDGINSGWENHHTADIVITGAIYGTALAFPGAGWIVGGAYFLIDMGFQEYTGKSLTQNLFDK